VRDHIDGSLYSQLTLHPIARMTCAGCARAVQQPLRIVPCTRQGASRFGRGFSLHSRVSRNFRQPTMSESTALSRCQSDLKPEYRSTRIGRYICSEHLEISGTGYRTEARNLIKYSGNGRGRGDQHRPIVIWAWRTYAPKAWPIVGDGAGDRQTVGATQTNPTAKSTSCWGGPQHRSALLGQHADRRWVHGCTWRLWPATHGGCLVMDLACATLHLGRRRLTVEPISCFAIFSTDATPMFRTIPCGLQCLAGLK